MSTSYSLSIHPECIEGIQLTKRNERFSIKAEHSSAFIPLETKGNELEKIENFLETHQWMNHPISLIIPTEEISFRTIHFPFQDKKKIQQTLPFEIQNEVLGEVDESYQYTTQLLPDGTANVFLSLVPETYLQALIALTRQHDLSIRNIDCAAHLLFYSVPPLKEDKPRFQIYLGAEETFINVIEEHYLKSVKIFYNRIPQYLREYPALREIDPLTLQQMITENLAEPENSEVDEESVEYAVLLLKEELEWLCAQFNLFLKTWQLQESLHVSQHGFFCSLVAWDGKSFGLKTEPDAMIASQETDLAEDDTEEVAHLSDFSVHWGILGELKKYGLSHLEGHGFSFYSEGTPLKRLLQKNRLMAMMSLLFLILSLGGFGVNFYLQLELLEKEIALTESQLQAKLKQLIPDGATDVDEGMAQLQNEVRQKKVDQQEMRFNMRTYNKLSFLQKISDLLPEKAPFKIRQLEYSQNRFSIKGAVDNYENLQILKSGLASFEEFKEKNIVETNSSNPEGIFFTISINR